MLDGSEAVGRASLYELQDADRTLLMSSAPLLCEWAPRTCQTKHSGGMEEWAKNQKDLAASLTNTCAWYHGTWQILRLLNMVAVPPWYPFYHDTLSTILTAKPNANVLISAAADYGMLCTLHSAILASASSPTITICDICATPLLVSEWYADKHELTIHSIRDNLLTSTALSSNAFDLIVTDELLTVLKYNDKPQIIDRWRQLLKPGGDVVTTAMIGSPTTPELRKGFAGRAREGLATHSAYFDAMNVGADELTSQVETFAAFHTRHMITDEDELCSLFSEFDLRFTITATPGECVNPTNSFQIVASVAG